MLLLAALPLLAGCASIVGALPDMDWNPLLRVERQADGAVEAESLGPFLAARKGPEGFSHAVRPLYQHKAQYSDSVTDVIPPFGRFFSNRSGTKFRLWPLIWAGETNDTPAGEDWQAVVFPILFMGDGPGDSDGYFALWPLFGRTRHLFGIDTFDFFLWPFFMRTHMEVTEASDSWTVLFLIGWTTGGPRDGSWRFLPFYRHRIVRTPEGEPRTDQRSVLWPFFTWGRDYEDTDAPSDRFAFWPLWSRETSEKWRKTTVLWPFFRFNSSVDPAVEDGGDFLYDAPWPIYRDARDRTRTTWRIFPLYSHQTLPTLDSTSFLWPLGWWRTQTGRTSEDGYPPVATTRQTFMFFPLVRKSRRTVEGHEDDGREFQLWPLYHADNGPAGREDWGLLSLIPARNIELLKPADELYSPFYTLWRHRSDGERHETRFLFDTVLFRSEPEGLRVSIPFLYSRRPRPGGVGVHQVLWGLAGARTDGDGLAALTLLGFDLWAR